MVMNNLESDTEEVFYKGKNYRKVKNDKIRGLPRPPKSKATGADKTADFQDLLHMKAQYAQDNTDEVDEPQKPDYQIFRVIEEQEHLAEMEELRRIQAEIEERRRA